MDRGRCRVDLHFSEADVDFRSEVRQWLAENIPREPAPRYGPAKREFERAWQRQQFDAGWAGINWAPEYGGRGLSLTQQMIWFEEYAWADGPAVNIFFCALNHAGPTLIARADDAVKSRHLPPILRGDDIWSQGFSEPGAGSDLAGIATRGRVEDDSIVVTGQKTWTSYAELSDYQELLVRTSTGPKRHHGLTWLICDMRTPGIDIRPIKTMTGENHFSEVFYDEVRIPLANVVGAIDGGWSVAMSTLSFERGTAFMSEQVQILRQVEEVIELARTETDPRGRAMIADESIALRLATARAEAQALSAMTLAMISRSARSGQPGAESSMVRFYFSTLRKRIARLAMDILGPKGLELTERGEPNSWSEDYLHSYTATIAAGSMDIQRNIIAERVLGLPRGR
jgi:alkylation response protein AidB-like acyl-CoA dehydrogenase